MTTRAKNLEDLFNELAPAFPNGTLVHRGRQLVVEDDLRNALFRVLREKGFRVKRAKEAKDELSSSVSPKGIWCATLKQEVRREAYFCDNCGKEILGNEIYRHGRTCEHCGALLYKSDTQEPEHYSTRWILLDGERFHPNDCPEILESFNVREASAAS